MIFKDYNNDEVEVEQLPGDKYLTLYCDSSRYIYLTRDNATLLQKEIANFLEATRPCALEVLSTRFGDDYDDVKWRCNRDVGHEGNCLYADQYVRIERKR